MVAPARPNVLSVQQQADFETFKTQMKAWLAIVAFCVVSYVYYDGKNLEGAAGVTSANNTEVSYGRAKPNSMIRKSDGMYNNVPIMPYPYDDVRSKSKRMFVLQPEDEFKPKIAWLMSFPNSGTSFTMVMTARLSDRATATNYGEEVTTREMGDTLSIYPRRPEGPYWVGKSGKIATPRDLPDTYVLTKTHCGSRCLDCPPQDYVETAETFLRRCTAGHRRKVFGEKWRRIDTEYPPERVQKAIHIIRNPMHNAIARFHLDYRNRQSSSKQELRDFTKKYKQNKKGFRAWCKDIDRRYASEESKFFSNSDSLVSLDLLQSVPCHTEFYKWTQWHNLAFDSIELIRKHHHEVPMITIHYEDYKENYNATVNAIFDFLELEQVGKPREFQSRSDYDPYYDDEHIKLIRKLVKKLANDYTWAQVSRYFD